MGGRARRGARGARRAKAPKSLTDSYLSVLFWVGLPILALVMLGMSVADLGPALAARAGDGTYGSFHGEERRCHEHKGSVSCEELWGTFRPEDGSPERYVRHLEPPKGFGVGGRTRALLPDGARDEVYRVEGTYQWQVEVAVIAGSVTALGVWLWMLSRRATSRA